MKNNPFRMMHFLVLALAFWFWSWLLKDAIPQLSTAAWKMGLLSAGAYLGYWIDRHLFRDRINGASLAHQHTRRAIVVSATILAVALAL